MQSRRNDLQGIRYQNISHAGLWLDKYLPVIKSDDVDDEANEKKLNHLMQAIGVKPSADYAKFYLRWKKTLDDLTELPARKAEVKRRMIVGLGAESVLETSVALHRTYSVPYIPGSALKGMAASYARQWLGAEWQPKSESYLLMFGDTNAAGVVTFFDALYVPDSAANNQPLQADIMTVHHKKYYGNENAPPADWDEPTPIPFVSATGTYLVAIGGPQDWAQAAQNILLQAFANAGIGAKTASGYGRLKFLKAEMSSAVNQVSPEPKSPEIKRPEQQRLEVTLKTKVNDKGNATVVADDGEEFLCRKFPNWKPPVIGQKVTVEVKRKNNQVIEAIFKSL